MRAILRTYGTGASSSPTRGLSRQTSRTRVLEGAAVRRANISHTVPKTPPKGPTIKPIRPSATLKLEKR